MAQDTPEEPETHEPVRLEDNYVRRAEVLRVVDGDTIELLIDNGFHQSFTTKARLYGVDTPEKFGVKKWADKKAGEYTEEYQLGLLASDATLEWLQNKGALEPSKDLFGETYTRVHVMIRSHKGKAGKYGRWLAEIYPGDGQPHSLNDALVEGGHADVADY